MSAMVLRPARSGPLFERRPLDRRVLAMPSPYDDEPCGGERVIDFALCLVIAAAVVGLLLLAL